MDKCWYRQLILSPLFVDSFWQLLSDKLRLLFVSLIINFRHACIVFLSFLLRNNLIFATFVKLKELILGQIFSFTIILHFRASLHRALEDQPDYRSPTQGQFILLGSKSVMNDSPVVKTKDFSLLLCILNNCGGPLFQLVNSFTTPLHRHVAAKCQFRITFIQNNL